MIGSLSIFFEFLLAKLPHKQRTAFALGYAIGSFSVLPADRVGPKRKERFNLYQLGPLKLLLDTTNLIDKKLIRLGWENVQRATLFSLVAQVRATSDQRMIFLDVGSHWGLYSLAAFYSACFDEVHAFEADPINHAQLQAQLLLNDAIPAIEAHSFVVTAVHREQPWKLSSQSVPANRGGVGVDEQGTFMITGRPLDSMFEPSDAIVVMKIDVEGHEREVIHGARRLLSQSKAIIQVESVASFVEEVSAALGNMGYRKISQSSNDHYFTNIDGFAAVEAVSGQEGPSCVQLDDLVLGASVEERTDIELSYDAHDIFTQEGHEPVDLERTIRRRKHLAEVQTKLEDRRAALEQAFRAREQRLAAREARLQQVAADAKERAARIAAREEKRALAARKAGK